MLRVRWQNVAFDTHNTHTQYAPTHTQYAPTYAHAHAQLIAVTLLSNMSRDMLVQLKHDIPLNKPKHMHDFDRLETSLFNSYWQAHYLYINTVTCKN